MKFFQNNRKLGAQKILAYALDFIKFDEELKKR